MTLSPSDLLAMLVAKRSCQEGAGLYHVEFAWVDWYAKRVSVVYDTDGNPHLEPIGEVGWDLSTAIHGDSPTLVMGQTFTGPLCAHELQVLRTGHDATGAALTNPRWAFTVTAATEPAPAEAPAEAARA